MAQAHGIPEVPGDVTDSVQLRRFLTEIRNHCLRVETARAPVSAPTNLFVTPVAGGNVIQFTRSDADNYILYTSPTANFGDSAAIPIGIAAKYTDNQGAGAVTRFYWLQGVRSTGGTSALLGPKFGTTLALGTAAVIPAPPPANTTPAVDQENEQPEFSGGLNRAAY